MTRSTSPILRILAAAAAAIPAFAQGPFPTEADAPSQDRVRALAAARLGRPPETLEVGSLEGPLRMPDAGLTLFVAGVVDADGRKAVVALRPDGSAVNLEAARRVDRELAIQRRGRISRELHREISKRPADESLDVVAWIHAPDVTELREVRALELAELERGGFLTDEIAEAQAADLSRAVAAVVGPAAAEAESSFRSSGFEVTGLAEDAPLVYLRGTPEELRRLAGHPLVAGLYWAGETSEPRLDSARVAVGAHLLPAPPTAWLGSGARVAIVEGERVCSSSAWLPVASARLPYVGGGSHATAVASCVASAHPLGFGIAPGATLLSANGAGTFAQTQSAVGWAMGQGAHILNLSQGASVTGPEPSLLDRYLDWIVRSCTKTVVSACGNSGTFANNPGAGFNQIAVGNYDERTAALPDIMNPTSSWMNPSTGVETPQVVAPGTSLAMLGCGTPSPSYMGTGTSFSSGIVAGVAALAVARAPALASWPEAVRAIVMASAWDDIDQSGRSKDGAGGVDARAAYRIAAAWPTGNKWGAAVLNPGSFDGNGDFQILWFEGQAGKEARVCISWNSTPTGDPYVDPLLADFDLRITHQNGDIASRSSYALQPFEHAQFTIPSTGIYCVVVRRRAFSGSSEFVGAAVSIR